MFVHLHCHFLGSYSDSLLDPERTLPFVKEMGQEAIAITDHGELAYCFPFYWACRQLDLHPVIGCEVYFVDDARSSIERKDSSRNHLILLAKDNGGFFNLIRLVNASWLENNFGEVRGLVDWNLLEKFHDGLIALSGCFWGSLPQNYISGGIEAAEKEFQRYYQLFGKDFYPELGRHGIADEEKANEGLIALSKRYGLRPVVTNDCHYQTARDWKIHDVLIKTRFGFPTNFKIDAQNYYLRSEQEMRDLGFPAEYYDETFEVARRCQVKLEEITWETTPRTFEPETEAVFSSRLVTIDLRQAVEDVAGVWGEEDGELKRILEHLPSGAGLPGALREAPRLRQWLERRPQIQEAVFKLHGLPRSSRPDFSNTLNIPLSPAREFLPLKRARGEIMTQYPNWVLEKLGIPTLPVEHFKKSHPAFYSRAKRLSLLEKAERQFKRGDFTSAALLLEGVIRSHPEELEARYLLAHSLYFLRRYRKAIEEYNFLEKHNFNPRKMPLIYVRQGWAYQWLKQSGKAREAFRKALNREGDYPPARYALGVLNYREKRYQQAIQYLEGFLELRPTGKKADKARALLRKIGARPEG